MHLFVRISRPFIRSADLRRINDMLFTHKYLFLLLEMLLLLFMKLQQAHVLYNFCLLKHILLLTLLLDKLCKNKYQVLLWESAMKTGTKVTWSHNLSTINFISILCAFWMPNVTDIQLTRCISGCESCMRIFVFVSGEAMLND